MKAVRELSRRERLRRLRELAEAALAAYGLTGAPMQVFAEHPEAMTDIQIREPLRAWLADR